MTRKQAREAMMQLLFELEVAGEMNLEVLETKCRERISGKEHDRSWSILKSTVTNLDSIDDKINQYSKAWKTTRMPKVDLAILRLAVGESRYADDVSDAVVVSESINLSKKFSTEQSASFIHGVLGNVLNDEQ